MDGFRIPNERNRKASRRGSGRTSAADRRREAFTGCAVCASTTDAVEPRAHEWHQSQSRRASGARRPANPKAATPAPFAAMRRGNDDSFPPTPICIPFAFAGEERGPAATTGRRAGCRRRR
uniref:Uncharacterized protein n=1 Tax=Oryza meridionalis TaxID=40149 RepID=A0A0E0DJT3_9ORYZ